MGVRKSKSKVKERLGWKPGMSQYVARQGRQQQGAAIRQSNSQRAVNESSGNKPNLIIVSQSINIPIERTKGWAEPKALSVI